MNVLIIEDEPLLAKDLADCICELRPSYNVIAVLHSVNQAVNYLSKNKDIQLIFSDIHLGDGMSFEIFEKTEVVAPIIFCTAYDTYAIEAFKNNGIDYILKPLSKKNINSAIDKFESMVFMYSKYRENIQSLKEFFKDEVSEKVFLVHHGDKSIPLRLDDIAFSCIKDEITYLVNFQGRFYRINKSLEEIEKRAGKNFFRANRKYLINKKTVKNITRLLFRKTQVNLHLEISEEIIVSKEKSPAFLKWLSES